MRVEVYLTKERKMFQGDKEIDTTTYLVKIFFE